MRLSPHDNAVTIHLILLLLDDIVYISDRVFLGDLGLIGNSFFLVVLFIDGGFGSALIQKKRPTHEDYSTIYTPLSSIVNYKGEMVRKDAVYSKQYLEGRYGADPFIKKGLGWCDD